MPESRRLPRNSVYLPVSVSVDNLERQVKGVISGRILDITNHGACMLLTTDIIDNFHCFHSFENNNSASLQLAVQNGSNGPLKLTARPVWFETIQLEDAKIFKIGINFISTLDNNDLSRISST